MINIAICDDNEQEADFMKSFIYEKFNTLNKPFKVVSCSNGEDLMYQIKEEGGFDLLFLDIELGVDNGIDVALKVRKVLPCCYIIFVSGYDQYYKDAFSVQPFQFIDKPFDKEELEKVIDSVMKQIVENDQVFSFEYKWKQYRIRLNEILYFISNQRLILIYTKNGASYEFYGRMNEVEAQLKEMTSVFLRVHKSYLLNMNYIKIFRSNDVTMQDDRLFPISVRKRTGVMEQYMDFASMYKNA